MDSDLVLAINVLIIMPDFRALNVNVVVVANPQRKISSLVCRSRGTEYKVGSRRLGSLF